MRKLLCVIFATVLCCSLFIPSAPVQASAEDSENIYQQSFEESTAINDFEVAKDDATSAVSVADGALKIRNVSGTTKIVLPVEHNDFVMEFDYTRLTENDIIDSYYGIIDTSIGINYRVDGDFGYEMKIHSTQRDGRLYDGVWGEWAGQHYATTTININGKKMPNEDSGHGLANWIHENTDESRVLMYCYYARRLALNETYHLRLQVSENMVMLYINGEEYLKDILNDVTDGTALSFTIQGDCTVSVDNLNIYTPMQYAEKLIDELPEIQAGQDETTVKGYQTALENVRYFGLYFLENGDFSPLSNYRSYQEKETQLENIYQLKLSQMPILNVAWSNAEYETESVVALPQATAKDVKGNELAVSVKVQFDGKTVKCENNAFTANEAGDYTICYIAHDAKGNETTKEYTLTVTQKAAQASELTPSNAPNYKLLTVSCIIFCLVIGANVTSFIIIRRRKK